MFWIIKQVLIGLLNFTSSSETKCVSLSDDQCISRITFIDLSPIELTHYPFMISQDKFNGGRNVVDDISTKTCFPSKTKNINVKVFNMITRIYEPKTLVKHISCDCKCKFNITTSNSDQK